MNIPMTSLGSLLRWWLVGDNETKIFRIKKDKELFLKAILVFFIFKIHLKFIFDFREILDRYYQVPP
jgi:hypothetical protein